MKLFFKILFKGMYHYLINSNYRKFIWLVLRYGDTKRFSTRLIKFNNFKATIPDCLSFIWQYKEIFVDGSYKFSTSSPEPHIIDCGANIGISILYFKKIFPNADIIAFEANYEISEILKKNIKNNNLSKVQVNNKAVWINTEGIEMTSNMADDSSIYGIGEKVRIPSIRLSSVLQNEMNQIDLLKIDIEGAEVEVIKDCAHNLDKVSNIFIEYHSFVGESQELDEILAILTQNKFRFFIKQVNDRLEPFINKTNKNFPQSDLQLNIYAYKNIV